MSGIADHGDSSSVDRDSEGVIPPVIRRDGLRWYVEVPEGDGTRYFGYRRTPWTARRLARTALGALALEWLALGWQEGVES